MNLNEGTEINEEVQNVEETFKEASSDSFSGSVSPEQDVVQGSESIQLEQPETDVSYNAASLFVISMIAGLLIFHILSRRWQT